VLRELPPEAAANQSIVPVPVAASEAVLPVHIAAPAADGAAGMALTVTVVITLPLLLQPVSVACT
jgi:uncharacterized protein YggU (UPF0235/DUF167 family)